jgi:alpha-galactosidase
MHVRLGQYEAALVFDGGELLFDLARGTMRLLAGAEGPDVLSGATSRVAMAEPPDHPLTSGYTRTASSEEISDAIGRGMALRVVMEPLGEVPRQALTAAAYEGVGGVFLQLSVENTTDEPLNISALEVLSARASEGAALTALAAAPSSRFYVTGTHMAPSPFVDLARLDPEQYAETHRSELMGCFADPDGSRGLLMGFVTADRLPSHVRFGLAPGGDGLDDVVAASECECRDLPPGGRLASERLHVLRAAGPSGALDAMERWASVLGRSMGARVPGEHPAGWCSWYRFGAGVTEDDVLANVAFLAANRGRFPVRYVQIDDGWQAHWGDWLESNARFPRGMARLASEIRRAGFEPGLWLAPFVASTVSALAREHPDWLVRDLKGEPVSPPGWGPEQPWRVLDCTRPEVLEHLERVFRTVTREWGYSYVKLDALNRGAPAGAVFHDPAATRVQAYRRGLEAIRRGAGPETFVLACNGLFGPSVGLADGMRVSPDVGEARWRGRSSASSAMRSSARRFFFHRRAWWNDPDCLVVRGPEGGRPGLSLDEARTLAAGVAMSGGMLVLSDDLPALAPERAALLEIVFPPWGECARPLDLFERDPPSLLDLGISTPWETWRVVAVVNWADSPAPMAVDLDRLGRGAAAAPHAEAEARIPARYHIFDVFEELHFGPAKGEADLGTVPAHGTRLLAVRRALLRPQLVGSTFHFTQGARELASCEWREGDRALAVSFALARRSRGRLYLFAPDGFALPDAERIGGTARVVSASPSASGGGGLVRLELEAGPGDAILVPFAARNP